MAYLGRRSSFDWPVLGGRFSEGVGQRGTDQHTLSREFMDGVSKMSQTCFPMRKYFCTMSYLHRSCINFHLNQVFAPGLAMDLGYDINEERRRCIARLQELLGIRCFCSGWGCCISERTRLFISAVSLSFSRVTWAKSHS